ncbi:hypothetical protein HYC85_008193 [Camellia sinensis]|uniref:Uncharacterized protein n=1 Tax=Camellia sinensis TaxID=4442 RepID=A0A7J7HSJ8_CAMSI|nr:hypothetical protein HYC85_008193 [Camellia sinensis]
MDLSQEIDDYIKETIGYSLGLPVSKQTLELKLRASEEICKRLRDQYMNLKIKLKEKDEVIERARAESSINAQALKKFVEENQKLAMECANLLSQCSRWEKECSLYDHDREALMDFGNEADERAKEAEIQVHELEEDLRRVREELQFCKHHCEMHSVDSSAEVSAMEQLLLESLITTLVGNDEVAPTAHAFLETNSGVEVCQRLLKMWSRAEEEVNVLFEENKILDKENRRLMRRLKEGYHPGSGEKHTGSASTKGNKQKSSPKMSSSSPIERKIDFTDVDSPRKPLSPLQYNSPDSRMHKM